MAGQRYKKFRVFTNDSEYYKPLRETRGLKQVRQYVTPVLRNPSVAERAKLITNTHIWKYGDRLYKLSHQYYGDSRFWWVIAWYNAYPCEADIPINTVLYIPVNLDSALKTLGVA
jgi:nucleoid-associated protein YgaU